jgi:hypothetical protein
MRQKPKRSTRTKSKGKRWRNLYGISPARIPAVPHGLFMQQTTDASGRMGGDRDPLNTDYNDQWALVELHRWHYGELPQPDDLRRPAFKQALENMGRALWNTEPIVEGDPKPVVPSPFNVASVFKFCQQFLAGRMAPEEVASSVTSWMAEQEATSPQALSNAPLTWHETLAGANRMIKVAELAPATARMILESLAKALEGVDPFSRHA